MLIYCPSICLFLESLCSLSICALNYLTFPRRIPVSHKKRLEQLGVFVWELRCCKSIGNVISICLSVYLSICPSVYLSVYLQAWNRSYPARLPQVLNLATSKTKQSCETSSIFELDKVKTKAILRNFVNFCNWQHRKHSRSARFPQRLNLTMSKTRQFCETSSIFEVDNIKNEAILRDFLQKWRVECRADGLVPMRFAICPFHLSKVLRLPRKSETRSYEVLHLSHKAILPNLKIWCSKMQPLSGNQRPDLLTSVTQVSLVLHLPREMHLCRSSSEPHACHRFRNCHKTLMFCSGCRIPCACHAKRSFSVQKWPERGAFCAFWLRNVLRATTASNFSSLIWPEGSAPAALASHILFDPPEPQNIGKTRCFATLLPFRAPASSFFWLFLFSDLLSSSLLISSLTLPTSALHLSILLEVWLLNFLDNLTSTTKVIARIF